MPVHIRPYTEADEPGVIALWRTVFPEAPAWNDPAADIRRKLTVQPDLFLATHDEGRIVGSTMAGFDGHRGWVYYVAVAPGWRRQGIGRALVRTAEEGLARLGCTKVNLQVRASNPAVVAFYENLGFVIEERISMGKRIEHRGTVTGT